MRIWIPLWLTLLLACSGAGSSAPQTPATEVETRVIGQKAVLPAEDPALAAFSKSYLVIVASKLDKMEAAVALYPLKDMTGTAPQILPSERFKNLMPCYHIAIAGSFQKKEEAQALSKLLQKAGIGNYVKNAGPLVPPSAALNAYCAARQAPKVEGEVQIVLSGGGKSWVSVAGDVPEDLPPARALDKSYDAWEQRVGPGSGSWTVTSVDGPSQHCNGAARVAITLGSPHFGVLQADSPPEAPACGSPELAEELSCSLSSGWWLAVPTGRPAPVAWIGKEETGLKVAAEAALAKVWTGSGERRVSVTRYSANGQSALLVEGTVEDEEGICGGSSSSWFAAFLPEGQGLGRQMGPWQQSEFMAGAWLVDADADGVPELLRTEFPRHALLTRIDGSVLAEQNIAYCDCPC